MAPSAVPASVTGTSPTGNGLGSATLRLRATLLMLHQEDLIGRRDQPNPRSNEPSRRVRFSFATDVGRDDAVLE